MFLDNNTIGEIGTISNASLIHRQAFLRAAWSFCDYYLGNRDIHQRIGATNDSRKTKMLNGLLGVALEDELNNLWGNLDANTRKMIVQDSPQAVLDRIQQDTGVTGNMHNVTFDQAAYNAALRDVVNEIENNNRMVILVFSDVNNPQRSHACIAFVTRRDVTDTTLEELGIFNPWGNYISINQNNYASFFDIGDQASRNWVLSRYVTFNY